MEKTTGKARKQSIIITAIGVISESGVQAMSTKEIAKRENISEATIFKYFETKNQLIHAVIDYYAKSDSAIIHAAREREPARSPVDAIFYSVKRLSRHFEEFPELSAITEACNVLLCVPEFTDQIKEISSTRTTFLQEELDKAKKLGLLSPKANSEDLANILLGTFSRVTLEWRMCKYKFQLSKKLHTLLEVILEAFQ